MSHYEEHERGPVVGYLNKNGAEIYQRDLEDVSLLGFAHELVRRAKLAKAHDNDVGNTCAAALLAAANSIRYVANVPAIGFPDL